jgi:hypothetical protein
MQNYKPFAKISNRDLRVLGRRRLPSAVCRLPSAVCRLNPSKILEKFLGGGWGRGAGCVGQSENYNLFVIDSRKRNCLNLDFLDLRINMIGTSKTSFTQTKGASYAS